MTTPNQPSQPDPPGDITGQGSWSEVQHMSEQDWKDQRNAEWDDKFNPIQDGTNFLIKIMLSLLAGLLNMVPIVGSTLAQIVTNIANGLNQTNNTAVTAQATAETANTQSGTALTAAAGALLKADDAKIMALGTYNYVELYNFEVEALREAFPVPGPNWSYVHEPVDAQSGEWFVQLYTDGTYGAYELFETSENIPTVPGDRFYLEWHQQRRWANYPAMLFVVYYDANDDVLSWSTGPIPTQSATNAVWTQYSYTTSIPAPTGTVYSKATLQLSAESPMRLLDVALDHGVAGYSTDAKMGTESLAGSAAYRGSWAANFISSTGADGGTLQTGTIECWFKIPSVTAQRNLFGIAKWFEVNISSDHKLMANIGDPWPALTLYSTPIADDNAWHHAALVFDAGAARLYLDGVLAGEGAGPFTAGGSEGSRFWFGGFPEVTQYDFCANGGLLDGLRVSSVARYSSAFTPPTTYTVDPPTQAIFDMEGDVQRQVPATGGWWFDNLVIKKVDRGLEPRVTSLEGGGTRTVYTSTAVFTNPGFGIYGIAFIGGGYAGTRSIQSQVTPGGVHGGYSYREISCASLPPQLAIIVGAAGTGDGGAGGRTSLYQWTGSALGTLYAESVPGSIGSILTRQGAVASSSTPGSGGNSSNGNGAGNPGQPSALAAGGYGGAAAPALGTGQPGGPGGSILISEPVPCGGAGGGAGGSQAGGFSYAGPGGAGGAPGGGGGGGGFANEGGPALKDGGPGGVGRAMIIWRPA